MADTSGEGTSIEQHVIVYLGDAGDETEYRRHKACGRVAWVAHFLKFEADGDATAWTLHERELDGREALTPEDIVRATTTAVRDRLGIDTPEVQYIAPSVGTMYGVRLGTRYSSP